MVVVDERPAICLQVTKSGLSTHVLGYHERLVYGLTVWSDSATSMWCLARFYSHTSEIAAGLSDKQQGPDSGLDDTISKQDVGSNTSIK
jgi:hypothetical protein